MRVYQKRVPSGTCGSSHSSSTVVAVACVQQRPIGGSGGPWKNVISNVRTTNAIVLT